MPMRPLPSVLTLTTVVILSGCARMNDYASWPLTSSMDAVAIVNPDLCKPKKCNLECKKACPINLQGKHCIEVETTSVMTTISEELCIGCALCQKRCPFKAIQIINVPSTTSL